MRFPKTDLGGGGDSGTWPHAWSPPLWHWSSYKGDPRPGNICNTAWFQDTRPGAFCSSSPSRHRRTSSTLWGTQEGLHAAARRGGAARAPDLERGPCRHGRESPATRQPLPTAGHWGPHVHEHQHPKWAGCRTSSEFFWFCFSFYLFLERWKGREKERERNIHVWLPLVRPLLGAWPATQACALTGNRTGNPEVCRPALNPLSYTSEDNICFIGFREERAEREREREGGSGKETSM